MNELYTSTVHVFDSTKTPEHKISFNGFILFKNVMDTWTKTFVIPSIAFNTRIPGEPTKFTTFFDKSELISAGVGYTHENVPFDQSLTLNDITNKYLKNKYEN